MEIDHKVQTINYGLRLCEYFFILQMVLRHCDVGGVYHWYVEQCLELPSGHGTQRFDYNMSFIWQLSLSKTIVDSLTLMHFQPGKSDCPSFIQIPSQFSQKNLPFEGQVLKHCHLFCYTYRFR